MKKHLSRLLALALAALLLAPALVLTAHAATDVTGAFKYTRRASPDKMVGMAENNKLFKLGLARAMNTKWQYFVLSEKALRDTYNSKCVLTLDEMPGWP